MDTEMSEVVGRFQTKQTKVGITVTLTNMPQLKLIAEQNQKVLMEQKLGRVQGFLKAVANLDIVNVDKEIPLIQKDVTQLCSIGKYQALKQILKLSITQSVDSAFHSLYMESDKKPTNDLIHVASTQWKAHCLRAIKLQEAFSSVEHYRQPLIKVKVENRMEVDEGAYQDYDSIWSIGVNCFKSSFTSAKGQKVLQQLIDDVLFKTQHQRQAFIDHKPQDFSHFTVIRDIIQMIVALDLYKQNFEQRFIEKTQYFYRMQSREFVKKLEVSEYLSVIVSIIENEVKWADLYFDRSSIESLITSIEVVLISDHHQQMLDKGFHLLVTSKDLKQAKLLFKLFTSTSLQHKLRGHFIGYIKDQGKKIFGSIVQQSSLALVQAIKQLIDFKMLTDNLIQEAFENLETFRTAQKEGFDEMLNKEQLADTSAHYLAIFLHKMLQKENPISKSKEMVRTIKQTSINQIISIFRFLQSKDIFEGYYTKHLAQRLLHRRSESTDREREFINGMKNECGQQFFAKVEQMYTDVSQSEENTKLYNSGDPRKKKAVSIEMEYYVLSQGVWPISQQQMAIQMPKEIQVANQNFQKFYEDKFKGRTIVWVIDHCSSLLKGLFQDGKEAYQFEASGIQSLILLRYNSGKQFSFNQLKASIGAADELLIPALNILTSGGEIALLIKTSVDGHDIFTLNEGFASKLRRLSINKMPKTSKRSTEESKETEDRIREDRRFQIDAKLMKIMKDKKILTHNDLVAELFKVINFPIEASFIKQRIESLIEKDYLKRTAGNAAQYEFIA